MPLQFCASRTGRAGFRRSALLRAALSCAAVPLLVAGCAARPEAATAASAERKAFGGERVAFGGSLGGQSVNQDVGRCQNVPALDTDPLLADFEQDSIFLRPVPQRYGVWYMSNDGSPEGKQAPDTYADERGGYGGSNYAVRYRVEGFSEWGAVLGFLLRYTPADGIKCPFNAAAFDGLAFMARGKGRVRVNLGTPETTPSEQEGRCQKGCWDSHGAFVFLTDEWTEQRLPWSAFAQQGWGSIARLDVKELLAVNFAIGRADQPAEVWLDDVRFIQHGAPSTVVAPPKAHE
jgi:hypothetical protein